MNFICGLITGIVISIIVCLLWPKKKAETKIEEKIVYESADEAKKKENLAKIEQELASRDKIANADIEKLLGVSDATATRYLDDLETQGKIRQISAGADTYYQVINQAK